MPEIAFVGFFAYLGIVFGLRTWMQLRSTKRTGFVGIRSGAGVLERIAALLFALSFVLSFAAPLAVWFGPAPVLIESAPLSIIGCVFVVLATAATFNAQVTMHDSWRIGVDPKERTELVMSGPFALVRNPIFSAMFLASIGLALLCPNAIGFAAPLLLGIALELQVRFVEEPYLVRVHGDRYRAYARGTGRFVPYLGRLS
jgi:protein-S-isoprenylcysteine O-methyltransferase Ste14